MTITLFQSEGIQPNTVAFLVEEAMNQTESKQIKSKVFGERGKPEPLGKNISEQSREPTNSIHI